MYPDHCIVYVLTNEAMPDYIKIGTTRRSIDQRMRDLCISVISSVKCYHMVLADISGYVKKRMQHAFDRYRASQNRRFSEPEPDAAADIIRMVTIKTSRREGI